MRGATGAAAGTTADLHSSFSNKEDAQYAHACGEINCGILIHSRQDGFRLSGSLHSAREASVFFLRRRGKIPCALLTEPYEWLELT